QSATRTSCAGDPSQNAFERRRFSVNEARLCSTKRVRLVLEAGVEAFSQAVKSTGMSIPASARPQTIESKAKSSYSITATVFQSSSKAARTVEPCRSGHRIHPALES